MPCSWGFLLPWVALLPRCGRLFLGPLQYRPTQLAGARRRRGRFMAKCRACFGQPRRAAYGRNSAPGAELDVSNDQAFHSPIAARMIGAGRVSLPPGEAGAAVPRGGPAGRARAHRLAEAQGTM